jgi:hypothetical protein
VDEGAGAAAVVAAAEVAAAVVAAVAPGSRLWRRRRRAVRTLVCGPGSWGGACKNSKGARAWPAGEGRGQRSEGAE